MTESLNSKDHLTNGESVSKKLQSPQEKVEKLGHVETEAQKLQSDLQQLLTKIKSVSKATGTATGEATVQELSGQLEFLKKNLGQLSSQSTELVEQIDKNVRANPYLYILGAAGIGLLLGKAWRS
jgi:ElaB/YqjD/DUF883 family membrane-anchored ribosome-binding protein